jgi:hypothetical protein
LIQRCRRLPGRVTPREAQTYTIQAEPAFFINDFYCTAQCDGDALESVDLASADSRVGFCCGDPRHDITSGDQVVSKPAGPRPRPDWAPDESESLTLEDAGFSAQPPDRRYAVSLRPH